MKYEHPFRVYPFDSSNPETKVHVQNSELGECNGSRCSTSMMFFSQCICQQHQYLLDPALISWDFLKETCCSPLDSDTAQAVPVPDDRCSIIILLAASTVRWGSAAKSDYQFVCLQR